MNILTVLTAIAEIDPIQAQPAPSSNFSIGNILIGAVIGAAIGIILYKKFIGGNSQNKNINQQIEDLQNENKRITTNATKLEMQLKEKSVDFKHQRDGLRNNEERYIDLQEEFEDLKKKALSIQSENDNLKFDLVGYKKNYPILESTINELKAELQQLKK
ncbi:hypothetical protein [Frigoriflavimonas asaccharolytica]|uniref:Uncharacterized protein HemX n=1 Tax=Frigoriflavimonas asaccharolytica TaxID=2735899 RepID=A0A8J8K9X5_9FLAO|nr:hypothetical protein [Frigoriflavimonas asaccharolytica]NRS93557.1 uncharacterized protein HemX [Frigoriflavimonas asaccharolytica]